MSTCDTCIWWGNNYSWRKDIAHKKQKCWNQKVIGAKPFNDNESEAHLEDGGWSDLCTGPKFGCIQHKTGKESE